jgi:predicted O-linked N-acetylglucosamine transferase (SPINDLY family)/cephalosporin hydroxylase
MLNNLEQDIITGFHKLYYDSGQEGGTWQNTRWMGVPILKCPLDLWIYQEIIFEIKPEIIIECGTFNGGSALFLAHLCDIIGYGEIVSIDIDERSGRPQHSRISYWAGSSISEEIIERVRQKVSGLSPVLVILDSDHSANHVIQELRLYSPLVTPGSYLIVEDTNINGHPVAPDFGSGPMEAVKAFLSDNSYFSVSTDCEKFYFTFNPSGYLKRSLSSESVQEISKGNRELFSQSEILRVDLGCGDRKPDNFVGVDVCPGVGVDIVADLNQRFPFPDNSVDELRAYDTIEHLVDRIHTMNEIWRVCKPGAKVDILVPSTDGRGAFQDPTHVSFWNINSFLYYCVDFPNYIDLCKKYGFKGAFKVVRLEDEESSHKVIHVKAELVVIKYQPEVKASQILEEKPDIDPFFMAVNKCIDLYENNSQEPDVIANIRQYRKQIADRWLSLSPDQLEENYLGELGEVHRSLTNCMLKKEPITQEEKTFIDALSAEISKGLNEPEAVPYLLAAMLYCRADHLPLSHNISPIPQWFINDYLKFVLNYVPYFQEVGEADSYYHYIREWVDHIHSSIFCNLDSLFWKNVARSFLQVANFIGLYFNESNLKDIYVKRAEILEYVLKLNGHEIDYDFSCPTAKYRKNRIGILASHFTPTAETFASLPVYEYLSRDFEVILYSLSNTGHRLEQYCQTCANSFKLLPNNLTDQVNLIRSDDLDILFVGTNITAVTNQICLLSMHRLARVQVTSVSSVVTTGIRHMDYYISGKLTDWFDDAEQHYQEKLLKLDGCAHCFSYGSEQNTATIKVNRESLGIAESAVVFICGANLFKITPELSNSWAKIIAALPNSVLVLYPFGPHWSKNYAKEAFKAHLNKTFAQHGVELDRLLILDPHPIPNRDDIKEYLKLADIYLDSYPFAGTTSVIDPLEVGLPVVARQGTCFRSAMGAALVQELAMPDLIGSSEESYIQIAIALGANRELRQKKSEHIQQKMLSKPGFLDSRSYSAQMAALFQELIRKYHIDEISNTLGLKDINLIIFPDWSQSEDTLLQNLACAIGAIANHPDKSKMTLLVDSSNVSDEDANLALSGVAMNLLMEEDLDVSDGPEISLIGQLSQMQREILISHLHTRIVLENENIEAIANLTAERLPSCELASFSNKKVVRLQTGTWDMQ